MNSLKNIKTVAAIIALISLACYFISGVLIKDGYWHEIFTGLAIELTVLVIASFIVGPILDAYHERQRDNAWKGGKEAALKDLLSLSTTMASFMYTPLGISFLPQDAHVSSAHDHFEEHFRQYTFDTAKNMNREKIAAAMQTMKKDKWIQLMMNLALIQKDLDEDILVYKNILPKHVLNSFLLLRSLFKVFMYRFGLMAVSYLGKDDRWPRDYPKDTNHNIYLDWYIKDYSELLEEYFRQLLVFYNALKKAA